MSDTFIPNILTIAGSDSGGGAGIQADIKAISTNGGYAASVITALTAQNTTGVQAKVDVPARFVEDQLKSVFDDIDIHAVKIGMLSAPDIIETIAQTLKAYKPQHIVLDPVMVATSGDSLITSDALDVLKSELLPLATLITPNIPEAEKLLRKSIIDTEKFAKDLITLGCPAVLLKGGHSNSEDSNDILAVRTKNDTKNDENNIETDIFEAKRIETHNTHGTGCTLSSTIATYLGHRTTLKEAVRLAKAYITKAIAYSDTLNVGKGSGPVHHFWHQDMRNESDQNYG